MKYVLAYLEDYFIAIFAMCLLMFALFGPGKPKGTKKRYLTVANFLCLALSLSAFLEKVAATDPKLYLLRLIASFFSYLLRPAICMSVALCLAPLKKKWWLYLPEVFQLGLLQTCFYSPIVFGFDEEYRFVRGPLGYLVFLPTILYGISVIFAGLHRHRYGRRGEFSFFVAVVVGVTAAMVLDIVQSSKGLDLSTTTIAVATLSVYFFLLRQDADRDSLTGLYNRQIFYSDSKRIGKSAIAFASIDLNRLKYVNDTKGHPAGDDLIQEAASLLTSFRYPGVFLYRLGGDEFAVLFAKGKKEQAENYLAAIQGEAKNHSISLSAGIAFNMGDDDVEELYRRADIMMYSEKNKFYQATGEERRRHSGS